MATSTALSTLTQRALRELDAGILIENADFDSAAAGSITSANMLRNSNWGTDHFKSKGTIIYRGGAATAADYVRYAGTLNNATGALSHTGANFSDTTVTSEVVQLWFDGVRPDKEILAAANRTLEFVPYDSLEALSHIHVFDGSMTKSTDTDWTNVGSPGTSEKVTTNSVAFYGPRSYRVVNSSANEGTQSGQVWAEEASLVSAWALSSAQVGTASLVLYDATNSAAFSGIPTVTHDELQPQLMRQPWAPMPTDCKSFVVQCLGTTASSDIQWNMVWAYKQNDLKVQLDDYIDEAGKITAIYQSHPEGARSSNIYDAGTLHLDKLQEGSDYELFFSQPDAQPHFVMFRNSSYFETPLFVQVRRPYLDMGAFTSDASTTTCPVHLFMPRFKIEILDTILLPKHPTSEKLLALRAKAEGEWRAAAGERQAATLARSRWGGVPIF